MVDVMKLIAMSTPTSILDHIVHLGPPGRLEDSIQDFEELGFTVVPGGRHADGLTSNALIFLQDGVYLERIAFDRDINTYTEDSVERRAVSEHWWYYKSPGWIDWANLAVADDIAEQINAIASSQLGITGLVQPSVEGGRMKPDGEHLSWRVSFPEKRYGRSSLPFFCQDLTPRERRVPLEPAENGKHPCRAIGVARIYLETTPEIFPELVQELICVLGTPLTQSERSARWSLGTPKATNKPPPELDLSATTAAVHRLLMSDRAYIANVCFRCDIDSVPKVERTNNARYGHVSFETYLAENPVD